MADLQTSSETEAPVRGDVRGDGAAGHLAAPHEADMSFLDHLEELRWALLKGIAGVAVMVVVCAVFHDWVIRELLLGPITPDFFMYDVLGINAEPIQLLNRTITGQFFADIGTVVVVGLIMGSPILLYYLWQFIAPALYPHERKGLRFASAFASFFLLLGIAFGYLILSPLALQFFQSYTISTQVVNEFDITRYFSMMTMWALGTGVLFELPVAIYFLTKLGVVTADLLRKYRRYAIVIILILAAFATPPDPVSQIIVAIPLLLLYELSIWIAVYTERRRRKAQKQQAAQATREE